MIGFEEKPAEPKPIPGDPRHCYASMGIYVFRTRFLFEQLCQDATRHGSNHDFGGDIIPSIIHSHRVFAYPFLDENRKQNAYWRDVGTLDAYYEANMDLVSVDPQLNIYDDQWPLRSYQPHFAAAQVRLRRRRSAAATPWTASSVSVRSSPAARFAGRSSGRRPASTATPRSRSRSCSTASTSAATPRVRRAIIDKGVCIPAGFEVGYDHEQDRRRGFTVTDNGVTVIAKTDGIEHFLPEGERTEILPHFVESASHQSREQD